MNFGHQEMTLSVNAKIIIVIKVNQGKTKERQIMKIYLQKITAKKIRIPLKLTLVGILTIITAILIAAKLILRVVMILKIIDLSVIIVNALAIM